jgi:hypothetical protein
MRHRLPALLALVVACAVGLVLAGPADAGIEPDADGLIAKEGKSPKGDDIYNSDGDDQSTKQRINRGRTKAFRWIVENDGDAGDVTLDGPNTSNCFKLAYRDELGNDVTDEIVAGIYVVSLDADERARVKLKVKARNCGHGTRRTLNLDVEPNVAAGIDRVRVRPKIIVPPPPPPPPPACDPSYPTVCIPPPPPDLDCGQIPHRNFPSVGSDPHGFDGDNDGIACET